MISICRSSSASAGPVTFAIDASPRVVDSSNEDATYYYDANGQLTIFTDARDKLTRYEYDGYGQRTKTIFDDDSESTSTYDAAGQLVAQADQAGVSTGFDYDLMGRLKSVTDAEDGMTTYGYDDQGNRASQIDALGRETSMTYDTLGRLTQRTLPEVPGEGTTPFETFVHDSRGRMTSHTAFKAKSQLSVIPDDRGTWFSTYAYNTAANLESVIRINDQQDNHPCNKHAEKES